MFKFSLIHRGVGCVIGIILFIIGIIITILLIKYLSSQHFVDSLQSFKNDLDTLIASTTAST